MKIKRKREIVIERQRSVTFQIKKNASERFCERCGANSRFLTIDEATLLAQTNSGRIFRLIENETLHSIETPEGWLLVCPVSLAAIKNQIPDF